MTTITDVRYVDSLLLERRPEEVAPNAMWRVARDYRIEYKGGPLAAPIDDKGWHEIIVPQGSTTDFASIPSGFRNVISKVGAHLEASVVHDYLYGIRFNRLFADNFFVAAMKAAGVPWWKRRLMYRAVRADGWWLYR